MDRIEAKLLELTKAQMEVQTQTTITLKNVERFEKKSDESQKSRRDVLMLLLGAIISAMIGLTGKWMEINVFKKAEAGDKR